MANFNDLPLSVRETIYRLHLVADKRISLGRHQRNVNQRLPYFGRHMPALLEVSKRIEREAAKIYYGENHFSLKDRLEIHHFATSTWPRHLRLVKRVTCTWDECSTDAADGFRTLSRMKSLEELTIRTDELKMIQKLLGVSSRHQRAGLVDPSPQQQLVILQYPGMAGLLALSGIPLVQFVEKSVSKGKKEGGPIPGGVLETQVAPRLMSLKEQSKSPISEAASFPFLSLPPELRNRVYGALLTFPWPVELSNKPATATRKKTAHAVPLGSVLNILAVNRQIHDEAVDIFYDSNTFVFHYSSHLHAFLQSLGSRRQRSVRDITVHYSDVKSGGISMVELTFAMLKQLPGLRRFEVIMHGEVAHGVCQGYSMRNANPGLIPGMKALFALRGLTDIKVRDLVLEEKLPEVVRSTAPHMLQDHGVIMLDKALKHLNVALVDAQSGKVSHELLKDNGWHMGKVLPTLDDASR